MSRLLPLLLALALPACAPKAPGPAAVMTAGVEIRRPPLDTRDYRYLQLDNGMKVLLVSDPETDMAAAALDVHVGQFSDPADREGLAHFLEHMLFLGTDAYPDVDAYRDFVQSHGGGTNAGTGQDHTRYHFSVDHAHLEGALDRFSAFFTSPRLDREYVTREREAVNSEYRLKVQTQVRRSREVRRATSNPEHGFAKFSVGNLETLADRPDDAVWDDLRAFYDKEYSASRMAVTVVGREGLDQLEALVRARFSAVPSDGAPVRWPDVPIYREDQLGVRIHVQPLEELRELYLEFPVPNERETYTRHPLDLLTGLFGQEGAGSPHALLTDKGWITRLQSGSDGGEDHTLFTLRMTLTEDGLAHVDEVAGVVYQYARLLGQAETLQPHWEERRQLSKLGFQFQEPARAVALARQAVLALQLYPPEQVLNHHAVWEDWDAALVSEHIARVRPDNARMFVTAPGLETDQVEPRYDVPYGMQSFDAERVESWNTQVINPALRLPELNPFVPENTELLEVSSTENSLPKRVEEDGKLELWHLADTSFAVPRGVVGTTIHLPAANTSLEDRINLRLWTAMVRQELAGPLDQAQQAGVRASLSQVPDGLRVQVQGFDDKLAEVLATVVGGAVSAPVDADRFQVLRDDLVRRYRNTTKDRPISQVSWALSESLSPGQDAALAAADHLEQLTLEQFSAWREGLWRAAKVQALVHGNLGAEEGAAVGALVQGLLGDAAPAEPAPVIVRRVPVGRELFRTVAVDHDDSAIRVLYQGSGTTLADQARWLMLGALLKTPAFTQLRTEQQLGYVVWARYDRRDHMPGLTVNIQSGVVGPDVLLERIEAFLSSYAGTLEAMDEAAFETVKAGLIATLEERPTTLAQKSQELDEDLALGVESFDRKAQLVELLGPVTKAEIQTLLASQVLGDEARRLVVQATGRAHAGAPLPEGACADTACVVERLDGEHVRER